MPCEWLKTADGTVVHINCGKGRGKMMKCKFCNQNYRQNEGKLCDFPVGNGKTCDAEMCGSCARTLGRQETEIGHGLKKMNDTIDVCPIHGEQAVVEGGKIREAD